MTNPWNPFTFPFDSVLWTVERSLPPGHWTVKKTTIIFTNPSARAGFDTMSIFRPSLTGLNSDFSFSLTSCLTKAEDPCLPYYLPITGGRIIGSIPFPRVLVLWEMQSVSSRIWTHVAVSISYDDNHYTTGIYCLLLPRFFSVSPPFRMLLVCSTIFAYFMSWGPFV